MKWFVMFFALALVPAFAPAQEAGRNLFKNGDFEKFDGDNPVGWETCNIPKMLTVVSATTKAHSGKYAVKCEVKDFYGTKMAGLCCQKGIRCSGGAAVLSGYYVLRSAGRDAGFVQVVFMNADGSSVGTAEQYLKVSKPDFTAFSLALKVPDVTAKLDVHLTLLAEGEGNLHEGSAIVFDDLVLTPSVAVEK